MLNQLSSTRWRREAETGAEGHGDTYVKEKAQADTHECECMTVFHFIMVSELTIIGQGQLL